MKSVGKTDVGIRRDTNQDNIFVSEGPIGPLPNLFIVADGMGGHAAGDFASRYAISVVTDFIKKSSVQNPISLLKRALVYAGNEVFREAERDKEKGGMGTTMVCCVLDGNSLYVANIGDSRLYVIHDDIRQITMDHSLVEELIRSGQLERNKGRNHPEKENAHELIKEVLKLPEKYRIVVHLFYYEDYSCDEISGLLRISENAVRKRLSRGREMLKNRLSEEFSDD